jgi:hypothetical protein
VDARGKEKFVYRRYATPWETLRAIRCAVPEQPGFFKPGFSIEHLDRIAKAHSDTESAQLMQEAKGKLFLGFRRERKTA